MDILLNQIIIFLIENHSITIPLIAVCSAALAILAWNQIKHGWRFYISKRRLTAQLREKNFKLKHFTSDRK